MCRVFGFRSVIQSQVHTSLVRAENALALQSEEHSDGWGVAYYLAGAPHIVKSSSTAIQDRLFQKVSGIVSSETVVAHIRKATVGSTESILNVHPFQFGSWVFAHNGNLKNFQAHREALLERVAPKLIRFILGDTDSEVAFYLIMSKLLAHVDLAQRGCDIRVVEQAARSAIDEITQIVGEPSLEDDAGPDENYFTFVLTNGEVMVGYQGGKHLHYSTYKTKCGERNSCPYFAPQCEAPTQTGYVNHLIFSSEPLSGENVWLPMKPGQMIGVDWSMKLTYLNS